MWNGSGATAQALSATRGEARGCSPSGTVIVGQTQGTFETVRWTAALPSGSVTQTPLGFITSPGESIAYGISADGSVIFGSSTSAAASGDVEAFIYTSAMHGIGFLPSPVPSSEAYAARSDGRVVVGASRTGGAALDPVFEAFVWNRRDGMRAIGTLLGDAAIGYRLETASGISPDGTVITGTAVVDATNPVRRVAYVARLPQYCAADFNASGAATVQDIFDFLTDWFAGEPRADITQDFNVTVQDVFDFLTLWFAGCN